jgi:single-strand DNA-binding protein
MSINKVQLIGRVGKAPEVTHLETGNVVAKFSMATDDSYKDKNGEKVEVTDWHNVFAWGKLAEIIEKWVVKGSLLYVEGKLKTRSYEKDGVTKYITEVKADTMKMLGGKPESANNPSKEAGFPEPAPQVPVSGTMDKAEVDPFDDLPFN